MFIIADGGCGGAFVCVRACAILLSIPNFFFHSFFISIVFWPSFFFVILPWSVSNIYVK